MLEHGAAPPAGDRDTRPPAPGGLGTRLMRRKPVERLVSEGGKGEGANSAARWVCGS